jgi:hypothetical protein
MRTAPGLALVAIGAIFAFAVTGSPSWINIQIVGWVLMLTGIAAILIPRRGYGWLRRRVVVRRPRDAADEPRSVRRALGVGRPRGPVRTEEELPTREPPPERTIRGTAERADERSEPTEETVEEYFEE